jgi:hypothetical protein
MVHKQNSKREIYCPHCGNYLGEIGEGHDEYDLLKGHLESRGCSSKKAMEIYEAWDREKMGFHDD